MLTAYEESRYEAIHKAWIGILRENYDEDIINEMLELKDPQADK